MTGGDPLFRLYCDGDAVSDEQLEHAVAIGPERTMEQDPEFAFRIIVDIAAKALSPAINDPTTAVLALDQIHRLLREVAGRQLDKGRVCDAAGKLRLAYRTPDWDDFVGLAVTEIRHFGRDSFQIVRRMRAMLESLIEVCAAASRRRSARGTGHAHPWRGTRFPRPRGSHACQFGRFAGRGRNGVIAGRRGAPWVTCRAAARRSRGAAHRSRLRLVSWRPASIAPGRCRAMRGGLPD